MSDGPVAISLSVACITPKTQWIFLTATNADGLTGLGEATLNGGEDDVLAAAERRLRGGEMGPPANLPAAAFVSALDQALHDLCARRSGIPLRRCFASAGRDAVPVYANINRRTLERTPQGFADSARVAKAAGHDAFKLAPFDRVTAATIRSGEATAGLAHGFACAAAVRDVVGAGARLMVDCHWRFDAALAEEAIDRAGELGLHWVECPIPETVENLPLLGRLRARANAKGILLAGCEEAIGAAGFAPYLNAGAYDVLMPDVKYIGGFDEWFRLAEHAARADTKLSPHNPSGPICHAMSLQVAAVLPGFDCLEIQFDESPLFDGLLRSPFAAIKDGHAALPAGKGCGVEFNSTVLDRHAIRRVDFPQVGVRSAGNPISNRLNLRDVRVR